MPSATIQALNIARPGNSLAVWLAGHHPDVFLAVLRQARAAGKAHAIQQRGIRGLADDTGTTTNFEGPAPDLETITVDTSSLDSIPDNLLTDANSSGAGILSSIGDTLVSAGSSLGSALSAAKSGVLGALGTVGQYVTSSQGLSAVTKIAAAAITSPLQQAAVSTQVARTAAGQTAAPITYAPGPNGAAVPVYQTNTPQGAVYQPLTLAGVASLAPSRLSELMGIYGPWLLFGVAALAIYLWDKR